MTTTLQFYLLIQNKQNSRNKKKTCQIVLKWCASEQQSIQTRINTSMIVRNRYIFNFNKIVPFDDAKFTNQTTIEILQSMSLTQKHYEDFKVFRFRFSLFIKCIDIIITSSTTRKRHSCY